MNLKLIAVCGAVACLSGAASAAHVYLLSSGDNTTDAAAVAALTSRGNTVTVGVQSVGFDGSVNLAGVQTVYLQNNANWSTGSMPSAGQQQLITWVNAGGRLVTSEWVTYFGGTSQRFGTLETILPGAPSSNFGNATSVTISVVNGNPVLDAAVPASFTCPLVSYSGTETLTIVKPGATTYFETSTHNGSAALAGWRVGAGSVFSFMSTCGPAQVADANFGTLFSNVMNADAAPACGSADFNGDGDSATDADIEAFFACLAGNCCATCGSADFNYDGDSATDADIEAFFRVLAGGSC